MKDSIDLIQRLCQQESKSGDCPYVKYDWIQYIRKNLKCLMSSQSSSSMVTLECRSVMIQWMYDMIDTMNMDRNTVEIAISYMDRFMYTILCKLANQMKDNKADNKQNDEYYWNCLVDRNQYQMVCSICLYISIKLNEPIVISLHTVVSILQTIAQLQALTTTIDSTLLYKKLERMECIILKELNYRLYPPTTKIYITELIQLLPNALYQLYDETSIASSTRTTTTMKEFIIDLASMKAHDYLSAKSIRTTSASIIAYHSIMYAMRLVFPSLSNVSFQHISTTLLHLISAPSSKSQSESTTPETSTKSLSLSLHPARKQHQQQDDSSSFSSDGKKRRRTISKSMSSSSVVSSNTFRITTNGKNKKMKTEHEINYLHETNPFSSNSYITASMNTISHDDENDNTDNDIFHYFCGNNNNIANGDVFFTTIPTTPCNRLDSRNSSRMNNFMNDTSTTVDVEDESGLYQTLLHQQQHLPQEISPFQIEMHPNFF